MRIFLSPEDISTLLTSLRYSKERIGEYHEKEMYRESMATGIAPGKTRSQRYMTQSLEPLRIVEAKLKAAIHKEK